LEHLAGAKLIKSTNTLAGVFGKQTVDVITAASDLTLLLDKTGIVLNVVLGRDDLAPLNVAAWVGKSWLDTVTVESREKLQELLKSRGGKSRRWRQVNHPTEAGQDIPVSYGVIPSGQPGLLVAVGRDLRSTAALQQRLLEAQQAFENDYARLRQIDARYRLLFQTTGEAVIVVDALNGEISEVNPAALRLLAISDRKTVGRPVQDLVPSGMSRALQSVIDAARSTGRAEPASVTFGEGAQRQEFMVAGSLFRQEESAYVLLRLTSSAGAAADAGAEHAVQRLNGLVERLPDCFVVTDPAGRLLAANSAFLDTAQLGTFEQARGQALDRWIGQSPVDLRVLLNSLHQHGTVRLFASTLRGELGFETPVEISAVASLNGEEPCIAFVIRDVHRPATHDASRSPALSRPVEQLTELIGRVSLKDLVRESTDMIERLCIEAALELTGDNRASAAEMLGLSRQSLYIKLRRHGLGNLESAEEI